MAISSSAASTTFGLTYKEAKAFARVARLFGGARKWGDRRVSAEEARAAGASFDDIIWVASAMARSNADIERRLRLWLSDCAARVLHIYERDGESNAPREAIIAARRFARGEIDAAALAAAMAAALAAARAAARAHAWDAAWAAAWAAAWDGARAAARAHAWDAAWDGAWAAAWDAAWAAAWDGEGAWQFDRLIARLTDAEVEDWPLPERQIAPRDAVTAAE